MGSHVLLRKNGFLRKSDHFLGGSAHNKQQLFKRREPDMKPDLEQRVHDKESKINKKFVNLKI